ncbi:MAG: mhpC [Herminiimonas sp.]|nr:mhpC [Herminiimonas sp.]
MSVNTEKNSGVDNSGGFATVEWRGRRLQLEYQWAGAAASAHPTIVFLHEGLGSIALWRDFPERFCRENGFRGLVFSRYGYGNSTPRPHDERWQSDFMHRQAHEVLPQFLAALGVEKPWLLGHSDGATIALLYAARFPQQVSGVIVAAPHIFVEDISVDSIRAAREAYQAQDLRAKLARFHADVDSAFGGWNESWLDPSFRDWNIEAELAAITCPLLAVQGEHDEYGTLEQVYGIKRKVPHAQILVIPDCGHSPHRDQPDLFSKAAAGFITSMV